MKTTSKEDLEVPAKKLLETQDGREIILDMLEKDGITNGLLSLALVFDDQGHPKHAEEAYEVVIEKRKETPRQKDQVMLFCQRKISSILRQRGLYLQAEEQCNIVLDLSIEYTGPISTSSLQAASDLALVWRDQGKFDNAFTKILEILDNESRSPYQDALHVRLVVILAIILRDCGHYDMSLFLTRNTLRVSDALFGNENPFTLDLASELSQTLTEMGNHRLAEEFARRALDGLAKTFGTDHPQSLKAASRLANAIRFDERLWNAAELFEQTLKAQELQLDYNHPDTLPTKCGLAATYALEARYRDSASILHQTLTQQKLIYGQKSHPDTDWTEQALENIHAIQIALSTDSKPQKEMEEEIHRLRNFFKKPYRNEKRNLKLRDAITISQKNSGNLRSQSDRQRLEAARGVLTGVRNEAFSNLDTTSVSGIYGTALHAACIEGNLELVQRWLNSRKDTNVEGGIFGTPLYAASYCGHIDIVNLLLENDARVNEYGDHRFSALQLALSMGHNDIAKILLMAGANDEMTDHWYGNALHEASMTGQESMVNLLLEAKAQPNAVTGIFGTALGAAAWKGNLTIVHALIDKGAIFNSQVEGRLALDLAASGAHQDIMEALIGAAVDGKEALKPKEKSATLEQKSHEQDGPHIEDLKPKEQSEPLEQEPLKRPKPIEPPMQKRTSHPNTKTFISSWSFSPRKMKAGKTQAEKKAAGKTQAEKTQVAKGKARLGHFTKKVTSATKSLIPSSSHRA